MLERYVRTFCSLRLYMFLFRWLWSTDTWDDGSCFALSVDFPGTPMYVLGFRECKTGRGHHGAKVPKAGTGCQASYRPPTRSFAIPDIGPRSQYLPMHNDVPPIKRRRFLVM